MSEQWLKLVARFDALKKRERIIVTILLLVIAIGVPFMFFIDPAMKQMSLAEAQLKESNARIEEINLKIAVLNSPDQSPDKIAEAELKIIKEQLGETDEALKEYEKNMVSPQKMRALLEDMLKKNTGLRVTSLKTLPPEPLLKRAPIDCAADAANPECTPERKAANAANANADSGFYKHGIELIVEGSYAEITTYLTQLEASTSKMIWSTAELAAEKHPKLGLKVTVYTLSLDKTWLIL